MISADAPRADHVATPALVPDGAGLVPFVNFTPLTAVGTAPLVFARFF